MTDRAPAIADHLMKLDPMSWLHLPVAQGISAIRGSVATAFPDATSDEIERGLKIATDCCVQDVLAELPRGLVGDFIRLLVPRGWR